MAKFQLQDLPKSEIFVKLARLVAESNFDINDKNQAAMFLESMKMLASDAAALRRQVFMQRDTLFGETSETFISDDENEVDDEAEEEIDEEKLKPKKRKLDSVVTEIINHPHPADSCTCPKCKTGVLQKNTVRSKKIVFATSLFKVQNHIIEDVSCSYCKEKVEQKLPEVFNESIGRYHHTAVSALGMFRYGSGLPSHRLQKITEALGFKIPQSTQWDLLEGGGDKLYPLFKALMNEAQNANVNFTDDTPNRIIDLHRESVRAREAAKVLGKNPKDILIGIKTNVYLANHNSGTQIHIYQTKNHHAGHVVSDMTSKRDKEADDPVIMSDGLSHNKPKKNKRKIKEAGCNTHSRRKFYKIRDIYPEESKAILKIYKKIFKNEKISKKLNDEERLIHHQTNSLPHMERIKEIATFAINGNDLEPNSDLGKAYKYFLRQYDRLVAFCVTKGAPLHNNDAERAIKSAIKHRKNSLFFKTITGAAIADVWMSIIETAKSAGLNPIEYMTDLMNNHKLVRQNPGPWLPWNYLNFKNQN